MTIIILLKATFGLFTRDIAVFSHIIYLTTLTTILWLEGCKRLQAKPDDAS